MGLLPSPSAGDGAEEVFSSGPATSCEPGVAEPYAGEATAADLDLSDDEDGYQTPARAA